LKLGRTEMWLWHMDRKVAHLALWLLPSVLFTSPTDVAAKYFNEYLSVCISPEPRARSLLNFLCILPMSMARSSSSMLTIGRIACRWEGGDGSAERGRSVIYDCLVVHCVV